MFEPGPLVPSEMPLRPRVVLPFTFEALAAEFPFAGSTVDLGLEAEHVQQGSGRRRTVRVVALGEPLARVARRAKEPCAPVLDQLP